MCGRPITAGSAPSGRVPNSRHEKTCLCENKRFRTGIAIATAKPTRAEMITATPNRHFANPTLRRWSRRAFLSGSAPCPSASRDGWIRLSRRAMACSFEVTLASEDASGLPVARAALDSVDRVEDQLTIFRDTSAVAEINRRAALEPVAIDRALFDLLRECTDIYRATDGAFDITSTPLSRTWGFLQRQGQLPSPQAIDAARMDVGLDAVLLDQNSLTVRFTRTGVELNLGAIGKGFALDRAGADLRAAGMTHALLSAGRSSLLAVGGREGGWWIDLISPNTDRPLAEVRLHDAALGTSGAGQQFVDVEGVRYGHIIDPRSGWPAAGILSSTVIADCAATADALSTAFFIGGAALAREYCASHSDVMAIITPEGQRTPIVIGHHPGARLEIA
jgi:FAD:protein FMN transferase